LKPFSFAPEKGKGVKGLKDGITRLFLKSKVLNCIGSPQETLAKYCENSEIGSISLSAS
jgi:hypothetical protein